MKRMKRSTAMVLAAAVVLSLLATALLAASKNWQDAGLGDLSQYYETGNSATQATSPPSAATAAARPTASICSPATPARP